MTKPLGPNQKLLLWLFGLGCLLALYFSPNLYGLYRFQAICEKEGGLRVYAPIERGWLHTTDERDARFASSFLGVVAARTQSKKTGEWLDVSLVAGEGGKPNARYEMRPADLSKKPRYRWVWTNRWIEDELRIGSSGFEITDLQTNKLIVRYYQFGYRFFNPNTVLLGGDGAGYVCPERTVSNESDAIQSAFSK